MKASDSHGDSRRRGQVRRKEQQEIEVRPFLRWAGSKRNVLSHLEPLIHPGGKRYIEPFVGSAALFFRVRPQSAQLSDINPHLIETFRQLKKNPDAVHAALCKIPRTKDAYLKRREIPLMDRKGIDLAATFIFLNRNCFNGLYRTNKQGMFNVPFSENRTGQYPTSGEFRSMAAALKHASLRNGDFFSLVADNVKPGDVVYLDPPYAISDKRVFYEYAYGYFSTRDLERIDELLRIIDSAGARFILSYTSNEIIRSIAKQWNSKTISINRNIAGFLGARRKDKELIITNFKGPK